MPVESVILENLVARNVMLSFRDDDSSKIFFGPRTMKRLPRTVAPETDCTKITLDWTRFDSTIPRFLLEDVFDILFHMIDFTRMTVYDETLKFTNYKAEQYKLVFEWVKRNFIDTKIMCPDSTVYQKR